MAQPPSSHRDRSSSHHHHRTISSTTLLLVLSLILAVLAVMLALPRSSPAPLPVAPVQAPEPSGGLFNIFSPKRDQNIVAREGAVAQREAEIAKREADLLAGIPAGVTIGTCLPCAPTPLPTDAPPDGAYTIIREVEAISPPWWKDAPVRMEDVIEREARVSEREKQVGQREETVGKRESDASRREAWIVDHLMGPPSETPLVETEEYVIDNGGRRSKELPPGVNIVTETITLPAHTVLVPTPAAQTVIVPAPANTRLAAKPAPEEFVNSRTETAARTTAYEVLLDSIDTAEPSVRTVTVVRDRPRARRWFGNW